MKVIPNPMTLGDYVPLVDGNGIRVNRDYQRGGGIWTSRAKSALIETIILGYPMPALFLHQRYDPETRRPFRDLVDGQQRTEAIQAFWSNKLRLSTVLQTERLRGRRLRDLEDEDFQSLVTYSLPIFLFTDATERDVREAFRRINSHTSVLNPEEIRHSRFQGDMKWFILDLTKRLQSFLEKWRLYSSKQFIRMADAKLLSEIMLAVLEGIATVKAEHLDNLYQKYDDDGSLADQDDWLRSIESAFQTVDTWDAVVDNELTKPYHVSLLIVAVMHALVPIEPLVAPETPGGAGLAEAAHVKRRLGELADALQAGEAIQAASPPEDEEARGAAGSVGADVPGSGSEDDEPENRGLGPSIDPRLLAHRPFVDASASRTNVKAQRLTRFKAFYDAIAKPQVVDAEEVD